MGTRGGKRLLVYLVYHPGSLTDYAFLAGIERERFAAAMVLCRHPYTNDEILEHYSGTFDRTLVLPEIHYAANLWAGFRACRRWIRRFREEVFPLLSGADAFQVVSDCSAYLPVNAALSELVRQPGCRGVVSIRDDNRFARDPHFLKTLRTQCYTRAFGLFPVYDHRLFSHLYLREPRDRIVKLVSPFAGPDVAEGDVPGVPRYRMLKHAGVRRPERTRVVVFYGDTQLEGFHGLSADRFAERMRRFCERLRQLYRDCQIVYKPHPQDRGQVMAGMEAVAPGVYTGGLTSQMHLDLIASEVRACYSVSSSSLLYSAALGIPSYTLYRYLDFRGEYPGRYFENDEIRNNPYLLNVADLGEMGIRDALDFRPATDDAAEVWRQALQ